MKRTLLALLLALTLLLTCAVPVFAEGSTPPTLPIGYEDYAVLKQGESVTNGKPFLIDLTGIRNDFNPDNGNEVEIITKLSGTMYIGLLIYKDMPETDRGFVANDSGNQFAYMQEYWVDRDEPISLVGMTLTEVNPACQSFRDGLFTVAREVDAEDPNKYSYKLLSDHASAWGYDSKFDSDEGSLKYWKINDETNTTCIDLDDPQYTYSDIVLIFEKETEELPKDAPLAAGETYYHMLWRNLKAWNWGIAPIEPFYAAIGNAADGYKLYTAADLGMNLLPDHYDNPSQLLKLTLAADSPLVGVTYKGQYSAHPVEFTAPGADPITRVVYYVGNDDAGEYKVFSELDGGAIEDATYRFEDTTPSKGKLSLNNGYSASVTYDDPWLLTFSGAYPLQGMVLFFETESSGEEEPETPVTPAPSYPQYYPDYDEPATVQPAPEAPAADEYVVVCRRLNVRRTPSTRYARIGRISRGDVVKVVEWAGKWAKIEWKGGTAYVHGNYIAPVD